MGRTSLVRKLDSIVRRYQNGKILGSSPDFTDPDLGKIFSDFIKVLEKMFISHPNRKTEVLRAISIFYDSTPRWAVKELYDELYNIFEESPENPNVSQVVLLNAMGRCFGNKTDIDLFIQCFKARFKFVIRESERLRSKTSLRMNNEMHFS